MVMIDWEKTEEETGFNKEYFNRFPKSHKIVYTICKQCNEGRWRSYYGRSELCYFCSNKNKNLGKKRSKESRKNMSDAHLGIRISDEQKRKTSESIKNSVTHKIATEKQRGGNDIVKHHYIYDESDLSKYTMKITRSIHTKLHRLFRKNNIEIPHIKRGNTK